MGRRIRTADVLRAYDATRLQPLCGDWDDGCYVCPISVLALATGVIDHPMRWAARRFGRAYVTAFLHAFDRAPCAHCARTAASQRAGTRCDATRDGMRVRDALETRFGTIRFIDC